MPEDVFTPTAGHTEENRDNVLDNVHGVAAARFDICASRSGSPRSHHLRFVPQAAPAALLFQFSNHDEFVSKEVANAFSGRASEPKQVKWYDVEYDLNLDAARNDRRAWLTQQLGLANLE